MFTHIWLYDVWNSREEYGQKYIIHRKMFQNLNYLSDAGLSWGVSSALPRIRFLASAYSASLWAKDFTCGEGRFCVTDGPKDPLLVGRFKMRICGGGAAGRESSWSMIVFIGERPELPLDSLKGKQELQPQFQKNWEAV